MIGNVRLSVDAGERSGKIVAELIEVSKSYGDRTLINKFSAIVQRGEREVVMTTAGKLGRFIKLLLPGVVEKMALAALKDNVKPQ